jgi:hypothetical protein
VKATYRELAITGATVDPIRTGHISAENEKLIELRGCRLSFLGSFLSGRRRKYVSFMPR